MKAVQSRNGTSQIVELPIPELKPHHVKVKVDFSAVSVGTELMMIRNQSNAGLGYSATGIVEEIGEGVTHVVPGQRVACYGVPCHREYVLAPKHLVALVPGGVNPVEAAFVGIGAIAIHALRQANLQFGETVIVVGLGILGQVIARIANAAGYRVVGLELMEERCLLLEQEGVTVYRSEEKMQQALALDKTIQGADAVLLCASRREHSMIDSALNWLRDRGRIVIVGDTGTDFDRDLLFSKEATIHISRAGGPGRYEDSYEQQGVDYPIGYVRWTEGRNMQEFLRLIAEKRIAIESLIMNECKLEFLPDLYKSYMNSPEQMMGVVVTYN
ncbi:alcohol dehydrogenase [Paenibacillus ferrarius]|uniref:Alcohol dehydrogenase n=1 Tax=Paenibacillus ferrarius TaxID=1469647 RepID=A0A1V4HAA9_9BACL|nr:zinc-binding alcohol dehydrogenase [Paenibacillus ferrarius]OPH48047.1 alcohol dehydrogenase [Paenibacillus ferrarius]